MNRRLGRLGLLASVVLTGACVSRPAGEVPGRPTGTSDVITRAEIERGQWSNVYDLVSNLRPRWVRSRGPDSLENPGQVQVYVDGTRLGDVQLLRTLPTHAIERLEWIDPVSAAGRWGLDHAHGVIFITYSRSGPVKPLPPS